jgi:hypothetical protein
MEVRLGKQGADFLGFQIRGTGGVVLLGRKRQYAVILFGAGGVVAKQVTEERP